MPLSKSVVLSSSQNLQALAERVAEPRPAAPNLVASSQSTSLKNTFAQTSASLSRQFNGSSHQKAVGRYVSLRFGRGYKATPEQNLWISIRKLTAQMDMLNHANQQAGRNTSALDNRKASKKMEALLSELAGSLPLRETQMPGFRKELRHHIGKMCEWSSTRRSTWAAAGNLLQRHESIEVFGQSLSKNDCIQNSNNLTIRKYHP